MRGYIKKLLARHKHVQPKYNQHSPYKAPPKKYGLAAQELVPEYTTDKMDNKRLQKVQQVIGRKKRRGSKQFILCLILLLTTFYMIMELDINHLR